MPNDLAPATLRGELPHAIGAGLSSLLSGDRHGSRLLEAVERNALPSCGPRQP